LEKIVNHVVLKIKPYLLHKSEDDVLGDHVEDGRVNDLHVGLHHFADDACLFLITFTEISLDLFAKCAKICIFMKWPSLVITWFTGSSRISFSTFFCFVFLPKSPRQPLAF
jgi:hypothetical protein